MAKRRGPTNFHKLIRNMRKAEEEGRSLAFSVTDRATEPLRGDRELNVESVRCTECGAANYPRNYSCLTCGKKLTGGSGGR